MFARDGENGDVQAIDRFPTLVCGTSCGVDRYSGEIDYRFDSLEIADNVEFAKFVADS